MMKTASEVIEALVGKTLVTAESLTGGGIGAALTAVSGASQVYNGGIIAYTNEVKQAVLGVPAETLQRCGAVSGETAAAMASGARRLLKADLAVSVTGLAGPGGDDFGNPVGTVYIGFADERGSIAREYHFAGDREAVRSQTIQSALELILESL